MTIKRRHFLIGLLASYWMMHQMAWAEPSCRQRALLIGVNQGGIVGTTTDVLLQKELLTSRLGFNRSEIVTLTDRQASRAEIEGAITEHLIKETAPGDRVLIHFSGCGTIVGEEPCLLAGDGQVIPLSTVELWLRSIDTDRLLCVIDAGYRYPGRPIVGNFRVRSVPWNGPGRLTPAEISYQERLKASLPAQSKPGIVLQAADTNQICAEATWDNFSSGIFTYVLTQQLWQMITPEALNNVQDMMRQLSLETPPLSQEQSFWQGLNSPEVGDAVILAGEGKSGELWLGGIPFYALSYYSPGSLLKTPRQLLQIKARSGLTAKFEVVGGTLPLQVGTLAQEESRTLPRNINLMLAMDMGLSRIERVDATSALSTIARTTGVTAGEQNADCVFGKDEGRYGLFTRGGVPIVDSFGSADESVSAALRRLRPRLESLLALKLLHLTLNPNSSYLGFQARINVQPSNQADSFTLFQTSTRRSPQYAPTRLPNHSLTIGDQLSCQLQNLTDTPLHIRIFCVDASYRLMSPSFVIPPYASDNVVPAQQQLIIPRPNAPVNWSVASPQGNFEVLIVVSRSPLKAITDLMAQTTGQPTNGMQVFANPLPIVLALLQDLDQGGNEDTWVLSMQKWATIGFSYRVV
ncbi:MAG: hypothetical protein CV045_05390 [Cyanobacteria bacterium M5B4]|nr:MAG: hypothetical protein CV045_05390 [Cyanobacteria bacterium M5B4]